MEVQRIISNDKNTENLLTQIKKEVSARLPLHEGEFKIYLYKDRDDKAHLALVMGKVSSKRNVLVRIHSECLTGDVFGSIRCDCGEQLDQAIKIIAEEGTGILLYLRQEGRGIGLAEKLHSYNLQDKGYDTVDANLVLGHSPDERDFGIAASILKDLGVNSIRLLSNNPSKFKPLIDVGINITNRISLKPRVTSENKGYLMTKISRMNHILDIEGLTSYTPEREAVIRYLSRKIKGFQNKNRPFITLAYAQSLDGCISVQGNQSIKLSSKESLILTHQIRAIHDSILVGIGTVISDNPKLNVRLTKGRNPQPVILDSKLRIPLDSKLVENSFLPPWIVVGEKIDKEKKRILENQGAKIFQMPLNEGRIDLSILLPYLKKLGIKNIMVEGGANIISSFIKEKLVDVIISAITPYLIGNGFHALLNNYFNDGKKNLFLKNCKYVQVGRDLIVYGTPSWKDSG